MTSRLVNCECERRGSRQWPPRQGRVAEMCSNHSIIKFFFLHNCCFFPRESRLRLPRKWSAVFPQPHSQWSRLSNAQESTDRIFDHRESVFWLRVWTLLHMYRKLKGSNPIKHGHSVLGMNRLLIVRWRRGLQTNEIEEKKVSNDDFGGPFGSHKLPS